MFNTICLFSPFPLTFLSLLAAQVYHHLASILTSGFKGRIILFARVLKSSTLRETNTTEHKRQRQEESYLLNSTCDEVLIFRGPCCEINLPIVSSSLSHSDCDRTQLELWVTGRDQKLTKAKAETVGLRSVITYLKWDWEWELQGMIGLYMA